MDPNRSWPDANPASKAAAALSPTVEAAASGLLVALVSGSLRFLDCAKPWKAAKPGMSVAGAAGGVSARHTVHSRHSDVAKRTVVPPTHPAQHLNSTVLPHTAHSTKHSTAATYTVHSTADGTVVPHVQTADVPHTAHSAAHSIHHIEPDTAAAPQKTLHTAQDTTQHTAHCGDP